VEITSRFLKPGHSWRLDTKEPGGSRGSERASTAVAAAGGLAQWWALGKSVFTWVASLHHCFSLSVSFSMRVEIEGEVFWTETSSSVRLYGNRFTPFQFEMAAPRRNSHTDRWPGPSSRGGDFPPLSSDFLAITGNSERCFPRLAVVAEDDGSVLVSVPFPAPF